jgi:hypothetical protein
LYFYATPECMQKELSTHWQLYIKHNTESAHPFLYTAAQPGNNRIISISEEYLSIAEKTDTLFFENDYLLTSRSLAFDLSLIDEPVRRYIHMQDYSLLAHFVEYKHMVLRYHSPTNEGPKDYDIFLGYPEPRAIQLIEEIYPTLEIFRNEVIGSI